MDSRCRLCANFTTNQITLIDNPVLKERILALYQLQIRADDQLAHGACVNCIECVNQAWQFFETVKESQVKLQTIVAEHNSIDELRKPYPVEECTVTLPGDEQITSETGVTTTPIQDISWKEYPWACCDCNSQCKSALELGCHHDQQHHQCAYYVCADCSKIYTKYSVFVAHVGQHRPLLKLNCDICYQWHSNELAAAQHTVEHQCSSSYNCTKCSKRFRKKAALILHLRTHLGNATLKPPHPHECPICTKQFSTAYNLTMHKRIHFNDRQFSCGLCKKTFLQKSHLNSHLSTHSDEYKYMCSVCKKAFKLPQKLQQHSRIHTSKKLHKCKDCSQLFREKRALAQHARIHTGIKPFKCNFCNKHFRYKSVLSTHIRQHTGEKPYSCTACQHNFTNWSNFNKHKKRKHGTNIQKRRQNIASEIKQTPRAVLHVPNAEQSVPIERLPNEGHQKFLCNDTNNTPAIYPNAYGNGFAQQQLILKFVSSNQMITSQISKHQ